MSEFLNIEDSIQDKTDITEKLYKLEQSRKSAVEKGTLTTEEVRAHFVGKHEGELVEELSESIKKSDLGATKQAREISKYMRMKYTDEGQYQ